MSKARQICVAVLVLAFVSCPIFAQDYKTISTKYVTIYYSQEAQLLEFLCKISGKQLGPKDTALAENILDNIVERVEGLLDMYPEDFHINIIISNEDKPQDFPIYSHRTKSITVPPDRVTDIFIAHEVARALVNFYFSTPAPPKMQDILLHYVDVHLSDEY